MDENHHEFVARNAVQNPPKEAAEPALATTTHIRRNADRSSSLGRGELDEMVVTYDKLTKLFSIFVIAATFEATLFIAYISATNSLVPVDLHKDSGRNFRCSAVAVILSISAAALAAVNAALFSLLASADADLGHIPKRILSLINYPNFSIFTCVGLQLSAGCCLILGSFFFFREFDPSMKLAFLILVSIALTLGSGPTISLFVIMFQRTFGGKVGKWGIVHWQNRRRHVIGRNSGGVAPNSSNHQIA